MGTDCSIPPISLTISHFADVLARAVLWEFFIICQPTQALRLLAEVEVAEEQVRTG